MRIASLAILAAVLSVVAACTPVAEPRTESQQAHDTTSATEAADETPPAATERAEAAPPPKAPEPPVDPAPPPPPPPAPPSAPADAGSFAAAVDGEVERLGRWLTGSFSSAAPGTAESDTTVSRQAQRIWSERKDGFWILVETIRPAGQSSALEQQVMRITRRGDGAVVARSYTPRHSTPGDGTDAPPVVDVTELSMPLLIESQGCDVAFWRTTDELYDGSTEGKNCNAASQGFGVLEMEVTPQRVTRWYRQLDHTYREIRGVAREELVLHRRDAGDRP